MLRIFYTKTHNLFLDKTQRPRMFTTPRDFKSIFGHFPTLCMGALSTEAVVHRCSSK